MYDNPIDQKFVWIPWDYNLSFSRSEVHILLNEVDMTEKPLIRHLLDRPVFLQMYVDAYKEVLSHSFTSERLSPIIDSTKAIISDGLEMDVNKFYSHKVFIASLEKDTIANVTHTWEERFNMDSVFLGIDCEPIPDSIWESGIMVFDTCGMEVDSIGFDTVTTSTDTVIYITIIDKWEYEQDIVGLKSFINRRVSEVTDQIQKVVIPEEPNLINPLIKGTEIVIYPNPADDFIILSGIDKQSQFSVKILDLSGKLLLESYNEEIIYLDNLNAGIYILEYKSREETEVRKFIKK
jgi:hypothetical protein